METTTVCSKLNTDSVLNSRVAHGVHSEDTHYGMTGRARAYWPLETSQVHGEGCA
jgi:hypothetical protein